MKHSQAQLGRLFVIRLEDGDTLPDSLEAFARQNGVQRGVCVLVGGAGPGKLVVGPEDGTATPPNPMLQLIEDVHEIAGVGTIFTDESGKPVLHMHAALGRKDTAKAGCVRKGLDIWKVGEVVLLEMLKNESRRVKDPATGFELLEP
jgi:predicted DNA-binding protein with PD1-like motif